MTRQDHTNIRLRTCLAGWLVLSLAPQAHAKTPDGQAQAADALPSVRTRFAVHDGFDRLVMALPSGTQAVSHQLGATVSLQLPGCGAIAWPATFGRRLVGASGGRGTASLTIGQASRIRIWRMGDRLVVDVLDAPGPVAPPTAVKPATVSAGQAATAGSSPRPRQAATTGAELVPSSFARAGAALPPQPRLPAAGSHAFLQDGGHPAAPAPALPAAAPPQSIADPSATASDSSPAAPNVTAVLPLAVGGDIDGPAILVPCPRETGAAAFERAGEARIVFDTAKPLDLGALKDDPVFGGIREQVLADGMELRLHLPAGAQLHLLPRAEGWAVVQEAHGHPTALPPIIGRVQSGALAMEAASPGRIVVLEDEATGARLLAGTQRGRGQRVAAAHVGPEFTILPSWFGLVVAPASDRLALRVTQAGFELAALTPPGLALSWSKAGAVSWPDGRVMSRLFDLPDLPPDSLQRQLGQALREVASMPRTARFPARLAVARAMLSQGLDVEAGAVLHTAAADDPSHGTDPTLAGLSAIAAWLSAKAGGAPAPAPAFDTATLGSSDEATLWRVLLRPGQPDPASQAVLLASVWPLILDYPQALRRPMLMAAAAVLQAGGQNQAWAALLAAPEDPALDLSRAALLQTQGKTDDALRLLDKVAARSDRLARAEASRQTVEIRLANHLLDAKSAADTLDRQLYTWRGGAHELALRERIAALRAQSGAWRTALDTLREAARLFPDEKTALHASEEKIVADMLGEPRASKLGAFELVTLADEAATLFSSTDIEARLGPILVDRLLALELPDRAEPILRKLFDRAPDGPAKAAYGVGLATLVADRGDTQSALTVLGASPEAGLSPPLVNRRALLQARLLTASGREAEALTVLAGQQGAEAADLQAGLMEHRHDWRAASAVLTQAMQQPGWSQQDDTAQRRLILRLARDEGEAGDLTGLHALRDAQRARFASGEGAELFTILTADAVTSQGDLPRSARELASLRALPPKLMQPRTF